LQKNGVFWKYFVFARKYIFRVVSREGREGGEGGKSGGKREPRTEVPLIEWTEKGKLVNQIPAYEKTNETV
jgi:hypothetical protein